MTRAKIIPDHELIQRVPLFSMLTPKQLDTVASAIVKTSYKAGDLLVEQGKKSDALYVLLRGRAQVVATHPKRGEVILAFLKYGDYVGEMSLIDNAAHSASVRALTSIDALVLGRSEFARCLPQNSAMAYAVMKGLVRRLRHANSNIESLAVMDVNARVARALLQLGERNRSGETIVHEPISRQEIAKMVGATRETVSRALTALSSQGFIELRQDGTTLVREHTLGLH